MQVIVLVEVYEDVVGNVTVFAGKNADESAKKAFEDFTGISHEKFLQSKQQGNVEELLDDYSGTRLSFTETIGNPEVTIHVNGGVAVDNPDYIIVHIEDHDNEQ